MFIKNVFVIFFLINYVNSYEVPKLTIEAFSPRGIKISIPAEPGLSWFSFHGNINNKIHGTDPGFLFGEIRLGSDDYFVYENAEVQLNKNDILYYWVFVVHDKLGYRLDEQNFTFIEIIDISNCELSLTTVRERSTVCKGQLIFEENFIKIDNQKWTKEIRIPSDYEDAEFVSYQDNSENCYTNENKLFIQPKLLTDFPTFDVTRIRNGVLNLTTKCTELNKLGHECIRNGHNQFILPPIVSAQITTKHSFSFQYGRIEIRAKFPRGDWLFPQLYLIPTEPTRGYSSGQIRIGFARGNEELRSEDNAVINGRLLSGGLVLSPKSSLRNKWMQTTLGENHFGDNFHIYTLVWTNEKISIGVDGENYANYYPNFKTEAIINEIPNSTEWTNNDREPMAPFDKKFSILLGVGAGGVSDFPDSSRPTIKPWGNSNPKGELRFYLAKDEWYPTWELDSAMQVDYVKVWAL